MSVFDPVAFTEYGGLDADAGRQATGLSAHVLRAIAMGSNRLLSRPYPLFNLVWPTTAPVSGEQEPLYKGFALAAWTKVGPPIPVFKKPGTKSGEALIRAKVESGATVEMKVETIGNRDDTTPSVVSLTANDSYADNTISGVKFRDGTTESVQFYLRDRTQPSSYMNTTTYGTPNGDPGGAGSVQPASTRLKVTRIPIGIVRMLFMMQSFATERRPITRPGSRIQQLRRSASLATILQDDARLAPPVPNLTLTDSGCMFRATVQPANRQSTLQARQAGYPESVRESNSIPPCTLSACCAWRPGCSPLSKTGR